MEKKKPNLGIIILFLVSIPAFLITGIGELFSFNSQDHFIQMLVMLLNLAYLLWRFWPNRQDTLQNEMVILCVCVWFFALWSILYITNLYLLCIYMDIVMSVLAIYVFAKGTPIIIKVCVIALFVGIGLFNVYHNDIISPTIWWMKDSLHSGWSLTGYRGYWANEVVEMTIWKATCLSFLLITGYKVFKKWNSRQEGVCKE